MNLTDINVTFTGKVLRWKLYLQDKRFDLFNVACKEEHQFVPEALSRLFVNHVPPPPTLYDNSIVALRPVMDLTNDFYDRFVTSWHILYYSMYYFVSLTCTVQCTYYTYCILYTQYMFPVSLFPMLRFHLKHLFTHLFTLYRILI